MGHRIHEQYLPIAFRNLTRSFDSSHLHSSKVASSSSVAYCRLTKDDSKFWIGKKTDTDFNYFAKGSNKKS